MADVLGTRRTTHRPRFEKAPDAMPIRLPDGNVLRPEVKTRGKLPKWMLKAIDQATGYGQGIPVCVLSQTRGQPYALLRLADLVRLLGLDYQDDGAQLRLGGDR
jgi:hypothetical protein